MEFKEQQYRYAFYGIVGIGIIVLGLNAWFWGRLQPRNQALMAASSLSAIGTLVLASVTVVSIRHQEETIDDIRREREKPLAIEELKQVINPGISAIRTNLDRIGDEKQDIDWIRADGSKANYSSSKPPQGVLPDNRGRIADLRLRRERPDLWEAMVEYDDLLNGQCGLADDILEAAEPAIQKYINDKNINEEENHRNASAPYIVRACIHEREAFGQGHFLEEIWEEHQDAFVEICEHEARPKLERLRAYQEDFEEKSKTLKEKLQERKVNLKREYGISADDLQRDIQDELAG